MNITRNGKIKLDIACGNRKKKGFIGIDIWEGADLVCDLEKFPWPFDDDSVDEIFCSHYIEHTPDLFAFMDEIYRILKPGGKAEFLAPYYSSIRAWQDPTHLRAISEATFFYFNRSWRKENRLDHYPVLADFDFTCNYYLFPEWQMKNEDEVRFAMRHYINVVSDINAVLVKRSRMNVHAASLLSRASRCWKRGNTANAAKLARKSAAIEPSLEACLILAEKELNEDNTKNAVVEFKRALACDRSSVEAHVGLVRAYVQGGRLGLADKLVTRMRKKNAELASVMEVYLTQNTKG